MISAKEIRKTKKGNTLIIYQDSPTSFHVSVTIGSFVSYDFVESPTSMDMILQRAEELETELENRINATLSTGFQESTNTE